MADLQEPFVMEWTVSIYPADIESPRIIVSGSHEKAALRARYLIDKWHECAAATAMKKL
jgi:hypothetical protein